MLELLRIHLVCRRALIMKFANLISHSFQAPCGTMQPRQREPHERRHAGVGTFASLQWAQKNAQEVVNGW
jgi:hypothetical protein